MFETEVSQEALLDLAAVPVKRRPQKSAADRQAKKERKKKPKPEELVQPGDLRQAHRLIVKDLEAIYSMSGRRYSEIFDDFLDLSLACLKMLPTHLASALRTGQLAEDTPDVQELWAQINGRYGRRDRNAEVWEKFAHAFAILLEFASDGLYGPDLIGYTYQLWAQGDPKWNAQYFTPWNVSLAMAMMTLYDTEEMCKERLKQALLHPDNVLGQAVLLAGALHLPREGQEVADVKDSETEDKDSETGRYDPDAASRYFHEYIIPAALPYLKPVNFLEPCLGSGIMALAAASCFPQWAVHYGVVQFYGMDIDPTCVKLAELNFRLYGLNSYHLRWAAELTEEELRQLPEVLAELYAKAQALQAAEVEAEEKAAQLQEIRQEIQAAASGVQMSLF